MADQASKDVAAQQRIVNHMQTDHHDSIVRYLEHYHNLSSWTAGAGRLTAVDLTGMTLIAGNKTYQIPFSPPLESYRDARERVVAMDKDCLAGLGRSDITVTDFLQPTGLYAAALAVVAATFLGFSQRWWFAPGQAVESLLGQSFARFCWTIQPWMIVAIFVIHGGELAYFIPTRLQKHSVNVRTREFWLWCVAEFFGGVFCSTKFDDFVKEKRAAKAKQQH